jgi:lipoyl(octanoyl) transferase
MLGMVQICYKEMIVHKLGLRPYKEVWEYQKEWLSKSLEFKKNNQSVVQELILVEHLPVYTLGKSADPNHLLVNKDFLNRIGAESYQIERGGDITFHGPGQLVAYPLLDLEQQGMGVKRYIEAIEEAIIQTLQEYNLHTQRIDGKTGIWLDKGLPNERKIAAIGIKCSRYLTIHGLALNVNTDMQFFNHIIPCGIPDSGVTSMEKELGKKISMDEVLSIFESKFNEIFK